MFRVKRIFLGCRSSKLWTLAQKSMSTGRKTLARNRWNLLQEAIINKRIPEPKDNPASKRVFEKFTEFINWTLNDTTGEIQVEIAITRADKNRSTIAFKSLSSSTITSSSYPITVYRDSHYTPLDIDDLRGYDKTGRICIWPAEQALTYWCLKNSPIFEGKAVIEIGGGFHCLAGLAIAKFIEAKEVVLTDGDPSNLKEISKSLKSNDFFTKVVSATLLRWDGYTVPEFENKFDQVIAADVVYDSCIFDPLIRTVSQLLKPGGQFILFNPTRVDKLLDLIKAAKRSQLFEEIRICEDFDPLFTKAIKGLTEIDPSFNRDWHYPHQVIFYK